MSTHLLPHSPQPTPAKKLRPCLSPSRVHPSVGEHDPIVYRSVSAMSTTSSAYTEDSNGQLVERATKSVRWVSTEDGCAVTTTFDTYSATEYDRTPLAPPSEAERSCVLPARGSRCLSFLGLDEEEADDSSEEEDLRRLPPSPFATPEDSDSECEQNEEWDECFERRRMMFARMCPRGGDAHPQFEGFRSLSATLVNLLQSVASDSDDEDVSTTPRASFHEGDDEESDEEAENKSYDDFAPSRDLPFPLFSRLRESSTDSEEVGTPSLISSADADSDTECSGLMSPRGSAVDFLPPVSRLLPSNNHEPSGGHSKEVSPVRYNVATDEQLHTAEL